MIQKNYVTVEDLPGYVKDTESKALINVNESEFLQYQNRKLQTKRIDNLTEQINILNMEILRINEELKNIVLLVNNLKTTDKNG